MHPKEREEANVRARMALVEIVRESRALVERPSDRRSAKGANGEREKYFPYNAYILHMIDLKCIFFFISIGRARASQGKSGTLGTGTQSPEA